MGVLEAQTLVGRERERDGKKESKHSIRSRNQTIRRNAILTRLLLNERENIYSKEREEKIEF